MNEKLSFENLYFGKVGAYFISARDVAKMLPENSDDDSFVVVSTVAYAISKGGYKNIGFYENGFTVDVETEAEAKALPDQMYAIVNDYFVDRNGSQNEISIIVNRLETELSSTKEALCKKLEKTMLYEGDVISG